MPKYKINATLIVAADNEADAHQIAHNLMPGYLVPHIITISVENLPVSETI